jgi:putative hydroxymethylpyrimidine transport system substrate-binding protein
MSTHPELPRRGVLFAAVLICAALCAGCGEVHFPTALGPPRPLAVAISGVPSGLYAALYEADANGDFAKGALRVTIEERPGSAALSALQSHSAAIAIVSEPALLAARAGGADLVAIGALVRQPLDGVVSLAAHPLASAAALAHHTIAVSQTPLAQAELATVLASAHLARSAIDEIPLPGDPAAPLRNHSASATLGGESASESVELEQADDPASVLEIQDLGVPTYTPLVIAVRINEAHYDGPLLRAFLQSLTLGERAVAADPAAAAATLVKVDPRLNVASERALIAELLPIAAPSNASQPFGYQDPYSWGAFGAWMAKHGLIASTGESDLAITDEFLPGQGEATVTGD